MGKRLMALAVALALVVGLCPGTALAAQGLAAGSAGRDAASAARGAMLTTQATKATKLVKKATKLMNALPKQSKVKLAHVKKTAAAFEAVVAATRDWATFGKAGAGARKAFLKAFKKKFAPACYALEKHIKNATAKAEKAQVKDVKAVPGKGSATVSWKTLGSGYDYEVYCSASESSGYKRAGSTKAAQLTVNGLDGGKTYYFTVRAYRADIPTTALIGDMGKVAYGKYSSPAAAMPAPALKAMAANRGTMSPAATGAALRTQVASVLSDPNVQDAFVSCRAYLREIKGKKGYATGTLKGDQDKMRGVIEKLNAYADKQRADRDKQKADQAGKAFEAIDNINPPSNLETEAVWQSGTGLNQVTVRWGVPAIAKRSDVTMLHWRVSWRKLGDANWSSPKTVAYGGSSSSSRECAVAGLEQGTSYEVRVGYRYQIGGAGGSYVTVEDWRSCTATTGMTLTFGEASFDYHFTTHDQARAALEVSVAGPSAHYGSDYAFWYEWYFTAGSEFDAAAANKEYSSRSNERGNKFFGYSWKNPHFNDEENIRAGLGLRNGYAVATVGVRTVFRSDGIETKSGWSTKKAVADPQFHIGKSIYKPGKPITGFVVEIPPLKGAKSYTVYLGKRKSASSSKVTGWKVAGTYTANGSKTTKAVVKSYGGKKLAKYNLATKEWAVKVVTNTSYGSSPGDYWVSYNHQDLIPHEGMIY